MYCITIGINTAMIAIESYEGYKKGKEYFSVPWNYLDLIGNSFSLYFMVALFQYEDPEPLYNLGSTPLILIICTIALGLRAISMLSVFNMFRNLI